MKFSCEKALLQSAISTASRAVSPKSSISALEGILVEAGQELRLTGYNLDTGIRTIVPAEISEPGTLVLAARLFGEIIRKLPDDVIAFETNIWYTSPAAPVNSTFWAPIPRNSPSCPRWSTKIPCSCPSPS